MRFNQSLSFNKRAGFCALSQPDEAGKNALLEKLCKGHASLTEREKCCQSSFEAPT
jgi:hypothetical protein